MYTFDNMKNIPSLDASSVFFYLEERMMRMAHIQPIVRIELDPSRPVPEICHVIMSVMPYHPGQEEAILRGVQEAIEKRLKQLKGAERKDG